MKVAVLIAKLKECNPEADVYYTHLDNDGCETCGYGASRLEDDIDAVQDLETKVVLE
jgi:hypothetical protein